MICVPVHPRAARDPFACSVRRVGEIFAVDLVFHNAYGPDKPWFYDPAQSGGGCLIDLGIHLLDAALWILETPIRRVEGRLFNNGKPLGNRRDVCEDYASARIELDRGAILNLACSWNLHAGRDAVIETVFYGTKGGAAMRNVNGSFFDFTAERFTGRGVKHSRNRRTIGWDAPRSIGHDYWYRQRL